MQLDSVRARTGGATAIAILQIAGGGIVFIAFCIVAFVRAVLSIFTALSASALSYVLAGTVIAAVMVLFGIRNMSATGPAKKAARALSGAGNHVSVDAVVPQDKRARFLADVQVMIHRGCFVPKVQLDLWRGELIVSDTPPQQPLPDPRSATIQKEVSSRPVLAPFCLFAAIFLAYTLLFSLSSPANLVAALILSAAGFILSYATTPKITRLVEGKRDPRPEPVITGDATTDEALREAAGNIEQMRYLRTVIKNDAIDALLGDMIESGTAIVDRLREKPEKSHSLRQFLSYYLPTTVKLLRSYDEFARQQNPTPNIRESIAKIEGMMADVAKVFRRELDNLNLDRAIDISTDIDVMQGMMQHEGIGAHTIEAAPTIPELKLD